MSDLKVGLVFVLSTVLIFSGIVFLSNKISALECNAHWENSGFKHRYSFFGGCQIQMPNETWIPAKSYREVL
jgi:hypothetical protein